MRPHLFLRAVLRRPLHSINAAMYAGSQTSRVSNSCASCIRPRASSTSNRGCGASSSSSSV